MPRGLFDPNAFDPNVLSAVAKAESSLPSPLKAGLIVGGVGAALGMLLGKSPLKWGLAAGGVTFGATLAADMGFEMGLGLGVASCASPYTTGIAVPSYHGGRARMAQPSVSQFGYRAAGGMAPGFRGGSGPMNMPGPSSQHAFGLRSETEGAGGHVAGWEGERWEYHHRPRHRYNPWEVIDVEQT
jgi:hypothetical protein